MAEKLKPKKQELVVITGASSGIGLECVRWFAKDGHPVLCLARRLEEMKKKLENIPFLVFEKCDITNCEEIASAIQKAEQIYGPTHCLINNAGCMLLGQIEEQDSKEWDTMIDVNIKGLLNGIKCVVSGMKERKKGCIINISSVAGIKNFDNHTVYCGTKFAVQAITEGLRQELAPSNVKVVTICPGAVETELLSHTTSDTIKHGYKEWKESMENGALQSEDVANACLFAYKQHPRCCVRQIVLAPTNQIP